MTNQSQQRETVIGVFADMDAAQQATQRLQDAGFRQDAIGALMPNRESVQDLPELLGGLGIPQQEGALYAERFGQGRVLVTVQAGAQRYQEAERLLRQEGAEQLDFSREQGTDTQSQAGAGLGQAARASTEGERLRVPLVEETLNVQKGVQEVGQVEIRKHVQEEQVQVPVELRHEQVTVTRHATDRPVQPGEQVLEDDQVIRVPVREETAQVQKQARVREEIEINKQAVSEQHQVSDTVRREEIEVNPQGEVQAREGEQPNP
jgi:uncharacterized protein (TIGR02271 family)